MNKRAMIAHAKREYPNEACGLVAGGKYYPCVNSHDTPSEHFRIDPERYAEVEDIAPIDAIFHSHPDHAPTPSVVDRAGCDASGVPWIILGLKEGKVAGWETVEPKGSALVGREFVHGVHDCLSIVLDFYRREMGIELGNYKREDDWWNKGQNLYLELLPMAGFEKVNTLEHGDVVLMQVRSPVPNHAGVYLKTGILQTEPELYPAPGSILHHMYGRDSKRDVYGGYWAENTVGIWRYVGNRKD